MRRKQGPSPAEQFLNRFFQRPEITGNNGVLDAVLQAVYAVSQETHYAEPLRQFAAAQKQQIDLLQRNYEKSASLLAKLEGYDSSVESEKSTAEEGVWLTKDEIHKSGSRLNIAYVGQILSKHKDTFQTRRREGTRSNEGYITQNNYEMLGLESLPRPTSEVKKKSGGN